MVQEKGDCLSRPVLQTALSDLDSQCCVCRKFARFAKAQRCSPDSHRGLTPTNAQKIRDGNARSTQPCHICVNRSHLRHSCKSTSCYKVWTIFTFSFRSFPLHHLFLFNSRSSNLSFAKTKDLCRKIKWTFNSTLSASGLRPLPSASRWFNFTGIDHNTELRYATGLHMLNRRIFMNSKQIVEELYMFHGQA